MSRLACGHENRVVTEVLRSDLLDWNVPGHPQEAGGREVMVEREGMADALRAHDGEARGVDEAEILVGVLTQQTERPCFGLVMDEDPLEHKPDPRRRARFRASQARATDDRGREVRSGAAGDCRSVISTTRQILPAGSRPELPLA
jgi:hypothetical protein